jgi:hypothetical protein
MSFTPRAVICIAAALLIVNASNAIAGETCPIAQRAIRSIQDAKALAIEAVSVYKLSPIPLKCVEYQAIDASEKSTKNDNNGGPYWIIFHERHNTSCGGDPNTGPRLFTIKVTKDGRMSTDAYGKDIASGRFRPLKCQKSQKPVHGNS